MNHVSREIKYGFLLAAGFGTRMGNYTKEVPKPVLKVGKAPLIVYSLYALKKLGVENVVINTHYQADQIKSFLKCFQNKHSLNVTFSHEVEILGTAGGIKKAITDKMLPENEKFFLLNTDIILEPVKTPNTKMGQNSLSHLFMKEKNTSDNSINETGWNINSNNQLSLDNEKGKYYYTGFSIIHPDLLKPVEPDHFSELGKEWKKAAKEDRLTGEIIKGQIISCGNREEYEEVKETEPVFFKGDEEFEEFSEGFN
jgi:MurNAc alpha-1-phosphate uridylyltransferase